MLLRYPGGKSRGPLTAKLLEVIKATYQGGTFCEPFFGGGGITFHLLKKKAIEKLIINDLDPAVYALWYIVINAPDVLRQQVREFKPSVKTFLMAKKRALRCGATALDMLVVNRLSHGGRGVKAGPQGGVGQTGKYKIGCRWNPEKLCKEIQEAHDLLTSIPVECYNKQYWEVEADCYYVDPPYYETGEELYQFALSRIDHIRLASWMYEKNAWVLSYDNHPFIRDLYGDYKQITCSATGNGGVKPDSELIITSDPCDTLATKPE
jgi:DNA adenine methylase